MRKKLTICCIIVLSFMFSATISFAAEQTANSKAFSGPTISVEKVYANPGESVDVPIFLSQNPGICGATISISYDKALTLTRVTKGNNFSAFSMTVPGKLSANPYKILFDAVDDVDANGLLAVLSFDAPQDDGRYEIQISYEYGDIVNGALTPIDAKTTNGSIAVVENNKAISVGDKTVTLPTVSDATVYAAFFTDEDRFTSLDICPFDSENITFPVDSSASYVKVFCWGNNMIPLCIEQKLPLN
ncbi:MAG: cohesin domain-containing protein [Clostridiales bacterium]|nr:cohesin domain-containing protein [Clostridiales bacterium]